MFTRNEIKMMFRLRDVVNIQVSKLMNNNRLLTVASSAFLETKRLHYEREYRGAEGVECGEGATGRGVSDPSPEKFFIFGAQNC